MTDRLRVYRMKFELVPPGEKVTELEHPDDQGSRSKLGGEPDWEQNDETPSCPHCQRQMTFVAQLDSIEHDWRTNPHRIDALSRNQHYMFGDVGMIYVFLCFDCLETKSIVQCG